MAQGVDPTAEPPDFQLLKCNPISVYDLRWRLGVLAGRPAFSRPFGTISMPPISRGSRPGPARMGNMPFHSTHSSRPSTRCASPCPPKMQDETSAHLREGEGVSSNHRADPTLPTGNRTSPPRSKTALELPTSTYRHLPTTLPAPQVIVSNYTSPISGTVSLSSWSSVGSLTVPTTTRMDAKMIPATHMTLSSVLRDSGRIKHIPPVVNVHSCNDVQDQKDDTDNSMKHYEEDQLMQALAEQEEDDIPDDGAIEPWFFAPLFQSDIQGLNAKKPDF
ncbi:hypothetical protein B0H13DRAFT_1853634 [Mycena leptocephala]|nr:hypothetical protein B0H13DRAFT_1853634 [Mycena leptocephala]